MALLAQTDKCPFCKETITKGSTICKHCGSMIPPPKKSTFIKMINTFRTGFLAGILFSILMYYLLFRNLI
ncbi:MAG: hypothetical protein DRP47_09850 [Candidatus Zixiibacteriota bacterium]|nr:MAG: hypothetical protein DRP47_09850 [candidate division Zixibacteria bacterium]